MTDVSTPTGTNQAAQLGTTIETGIVNIGVAAGEAILFAEVPFLAFPGLKQLVDLLIGWLSGYLIRGLSTVVTFAVIDVQVGAEKSDFNDALAALKAAQAGGDPSAIAKAMAAFQVAVQNMGHSDGSGPVP